tara:strand:+ start:3467 stop:4054 length:588 start_codon:yes stop_codon:yes gene_type:complete
MYKTIFLVLLVLVNTSITATKESAHEANRDKGPLKPKESTNVKTLVMLHNPKVAGQSLRSSLSAATDAHLISASDGKDIGHGDLKHSYLRAQKVLKNDLKQAIPFVFVRNPFQRLLSAFFHVSERGEIHLQHALPSELKIQYIKQYQKYGYNFEQFMKDGAFTTSSLPHYKPQVTWVLNTKKERCVNFVGYFETL